MFNRLLKLPLDQHNSIFLFGPRGTGKTSWLKEHLHDALYIDLLDFTFYQPLSANPNRLDTLIPPGFTDWIVIDEVQRIVDFIIYGPRGFHAFEMQRSATINSKALSGLKKFGEDNPEAQLYILYLGKQKEYYGNITE